MTQYKLSTKRVDEREEGYDCNVKALERDSVVVLPPKEYRCGVTLLQLATASLLTRFLLKVFSEFTGVYYWVVPQDLIFRTNLADLRAYGKWPENDEPFTIFIPHTVSGKLLSVAAMVLRLMVQLVRRRSLVRWEAARLGVENDCVSLFQRIPVMTCKFEVTVRFPYPPGKRLCRIVDWIVSPFMMSRTALKEAYEKECLVLTRTGVRSFGPQESIYTVVLEEWSQVYWWQKQIIRKMLSAMAHHQVLRSMVYRDGVLSLIEIAVGEMPAEEYYQIDRLTECMPIRFQGNVLIEKTDACRRMSGDFVKWLTRGVSYIARVDGVYLTNCETKMSIISRQSRIFLGSKGSLMRRVVQRSALLRYFCRKAVGTRRMQFRWLGGNFEDVSPSDATLLRYVLRSDKFDLTSGLKFYSGNVCRNEMCGETLTNDQMLLWALFRIKSLFRVVRGVYGVLSIRSSRVTQYVSSYYQLNDICEIDL